MSLFDHDAPEGLTMKITGNLAEDQYFLRMPILNELTGVIPKDPNLQILVFHGEVRHGGPIPWHFHNGPIVSVILQGEMIFQLEDKAFHYKAGDVLVEPVGVIHRAYNPNPDVTLAAMMFQLTPEGLDHIVNVQIPTEEMPLTAPQGDKFPGSDRKVGKLAGS